MRQDLKIDDPRQRTVPELFTEQAVLRPHAVAVRYGEKTLSYGDLGSRSHRLARHLRGLGVSLESRVGVFLEPGCDMVVALLGILRAGGTYVPLDPTYPQERLAFMLEDSAPPVVISQSSLVLSLPATEAEVVVLDEEQENRAAGEEDHREVLCPEVGGENLAYVMYTSGSTGRPKGVGIPHRGIVRLVVSTNYVTLGPEDRIAQIANTSFDAATFEFWGPLLNGGSVVGIAPAVALEPSRFAIELRRRRITSMFLTTALFNQIVRHRPDAFSTLDDLMVGGEAVDPRWVREALEFGAPKRLHNAYGPTENTTFSTFFPVQEVSPDAPGIPIGYDITNSTTYVVDHALEEVPKGQTGELLLGGAGLARGYQERARITAQRFIPDPFSERVGERLFRTGDLVRREDDCAIEFEGRVDHQIKLRGFRIELGEIEAALASHPRVAMSTVLVQARSASAEDQSLAAYLVAQDGDSDLESETAKKGGEEQVAQWQMIFEDLYGAEEEGGVPEDPTFDITGWLSTYTEEPIPAEEMREWLQDTISSITALEPQKVLEIGCGTGMLLFRIAPTAGLYVGTDISQRVLDDVEKELERRGDLPQVQLLARPADQFDGFAPASFDTVLLNSVVQYFPSAEYLATVLRRAAQVVRPGGAIFVGDVRNLSLLDPFHAAVELFQASGELSLEELRQRIEGRRRRENELVLDPAFFIALQEQVAEIGSVEILPKRGRAKNELTAYRYQVVLRVGPRESPPPPIPWFDWRAEDFSLSALRERLRDSEPPWLGLTGVPNLRVLRDVVTVRRLADCEASETVAALRQEVEGLAEGAIDPQDLWDLEGEFPYQVQVGQTNDREGSLAVVLRRRDSSTAGQLSSQGEQGMASPWSVGPGGHHALIQNPLPKAAGWELQELANYPARGAVDLPRSHELRAFLAAKLPPFMVPSSFLFVEAMPLTANGKVDREALGRLEEGHPEGEISHRDLPRTPLQDLLANLWGQVLGLERVGIHDDFFALGGHSLKATQVVSRLRETAGINITIRQAMETATVAELAEVIENSERRQEGRRDMPPLTRRARPGEAVPVSFAQRRLWFLHRWLPGNLAYNVPLLLHFHGPLEVAALEAALDEISRRHGALRTTFQEGAEGPLQVVTPPVRETLPWVDLSALGKEALPRAEKLCAARGLKPYDLASGPLWRRLLVQLGGEEFLLLAGFHHIIFDGWSMGVFYRELAQLYDAAKLHRPSPFPLPEIQLEDFALWQHSWLEGEALADELTWWRERLAGAPTVLELPADRPRRPLGERGATGRSDRFVFASTLSSSLEELGQRRGATLFMVLLAAFQIFLARLSGQQDLLLGAPVANRTRREIEGLIGFFVNTLALRARFEGVATFADLLDRARQETLAAYAHQDLPFETLVQALDIERSVDVAPLVQVMMVLQSAPMEPVQPTGLSLDVRLLPTAAARSDLGLEWAVEATGLSAEVEYNSELFDASTIARFMGYLTVLLQAVVRDPDLPLDRLSILSQGERHQLLVEWNDTSTLRQQTPWSPVHGIFTRRAALWPHAVAVEQGEVHLSFGALRGKSLGLAGLLKSRGLQPEALVALSIHRSPELVIAMLAVLEAGGAYIPLDPEHPEERRASLVRESGASWLLTSDGSPYEEKKGHATRLDIRREAGAILVDPVGDDPSVRPISPGRLAYVLYTSGSSGRPKGVMMSHGALMNFLQWMIESFELAAGDAYLARTPAVFDPSVKEFFLPLMSGGRIAMVEGEKEGDFTYLAKTIVQRRIRHMQVVPSQAKLLLQEPDLEGSVLRQFFCGGETLTTERAEQLAHSSLGGLDLFNFYGPTETCVLVTWERFPAAVSADPWQSLAIGRPIGNTQAYVVDSALRPCLVGVPGELLIAGGSLARGYLGAPRQTAEAFAPDPFATEPGARLYRTGDVVQSLKDGRLIFQQRRDDQIKLHGLRIEPAEIETALLTHPAVGSVVITSQEGRLVAWLLASGEDSPSTAEFREFLARLLPIHMVPTHFLWLDSLPMTVTGKIDRAELQGRALPASAHQATADAPQTPTEEILAGLWTEVLGLEAVGRGQSFFHLGGHSLLATRVTSRAGTLFGVRLGPRQLFDHPTLAALAAEIDRVRGAGQSGREAAITSVSRQEPLVLSFAQERLWFLNQLSPDDVTYNTTAPLELVGRLDVEALRRAFERLIHRHEVLRTTFVRLGDQPVQKIAPAGHHPLPLVDLRSLGETARRERVQRLTFEEEQRPYDLARGPLFRTLLLHLAADRHALLMSCHHIVFDGWSLDVLMDETIAFYEAELNASSEEEKREREGAGLPPLPLQYADYAAWQRRTLAGEALEEQLSWWRKTLHAGESSARLPVDFPRGQAGPSRARHRRFQISATTSEALRRLARQENATLFMTLLAAFKTLLHRLTGGTSVAVGTPIANRQQVETEGLIGFFVNTLVIRSDFSGRPSFRTILGRVRDASLGAYDHQDLPYEKLVADLQAHGRGVSQPPFQALFTLEIRPDGSLEGPASQARQASGLLFRPLPTAALGRQGAAFDLSLGLMDSGGPKAPFVGGLDYDASLFEGATIDTVLQRFQDLLEHLVKSPDRAVSDLEILSPREEQQLHAVAAQARTEELQAGRGGIDEEQMEDTEKRAEEGLRAKVTARKKGLSDAKRALLARRLKGRKKGTAPRVDTIPRRPETGPALLSYAQERLWFLDQLDPGSPTYNMTLPLRLGKSLDLAALTDSFGELWRRHEGARTRFVVQDGVPMQVADPPQRALAIRRGLPLVDLSALAEARREGEVERLLEAECGHQFDLKRGPLVRVTLLRLRPTGDEHVLFFNIHHIISDGWSTSILTSELSALYGAWAGASRGAGRPAVLADPTLQYSDFAHWQRQWLQGKELERQLTYWRGQLGGDLPVLDLPSDRPRPAIQTFRGGTFRQSLGLDLSGALRQLARRAETTLFVTLLGAFTGLLGRLGGQEEVLVGTPIAGRGRSELEGLVGIFLNTLVLRSDLRGEPSFEELLARLHEVSLGAFAHQDLPFERLLEELAPARDLSRTPLFQVFFNLINLGSVQSPAVSGATKERQGAALDIEELNPQDLFDVSSKFDLTLYVDDRPEIVVDWVYNADLFDHARMVEMAAQFKILLAAMVQAPQTALAAVSLVTSMSAQVLPDPAEPLSDRFEGSVAELFQAQVADAPHRMAVVDGEVHLTYAALAAGCRRFAEELCFRGVKPGDVVAIFGHRDASLLTAIVATLESGAAFLVLDPAYPAPRLLACLEQLGSRLAGVVQLQAAGELPLELNTWLIAHQAFLYPLSGATEDARIEAGERVPLPTPVQSDSLAYVAFTSGSTGAPKGILGRHGSLTHFIPWQRQAFALGPEDRYSLVSGLAHDPLHREIFTPLVSGATVVIPRSEDLDLAGRAARFMERERITIAHLTPAMGQLLAIPGAEGTAAQLEALRWAFYVGDILTHHDVERLQGLAPKVKVVNYFGSTETQRAVGYYLVEEGGEQSGVVPVGHGMPNVQLLLLTARDSLAGVGEVGEICVRSPHLALGYLGDEGLTNERFVQLPEGLGGSRDAAQSRRMYRTGDLGRYRLNGGVEVVGRADRQVKIRGVRIELGEIEAALGAHPAVREAVVVRRQEDERPGYLVAYVTGPSAPLSAARGQELREHLRQHLPEAMVPAFYVALETLPLTPNRKVDRGALPAPDTGSGESYFAPRTPLEEVLAELWREVLDLRQPVSIEASFFELGGHSLLAAQLMSRVRQALQVEIPLRQLFETPTVRTFSTVVGASRGGSRSAEPEPILPDEENRYQPFPMTEVQQAYWIGRSGEFELGNVATHSYLEFELPDLDLQRFEAAWRQLIDRHDMLRAVMLPDGRQRVLETVPSYRIAALDLRGRSADEVAAAMAETRGELSHQVLDPEVWPLFDLRASVLDGERVRLHISRDLLIYDAWSGSLLFEELMATYHGGGEGLETLEITFRDYVMAEQAERQGAAYQRSEEYWEKRLDTLPPAPELPLAIDPGKLERPRFARHSGYLPADLWRLVQQRASRAGLTPSAVLLAAYAQVLAAFSKSPAFTLNLTLFNRQPRHPQVHQLVGDFTSLTLLEVAGRAGESFEDRARRIQQQLWDDLDHRAVGGVWVQRQLARRRGESGGVGMPVVFTSTLGLTRVAGTSSDSPAPEAAESAAEQGGGKLVFNITQTPQVWLDHQISEEEDRLSYIWDAVADLFPDGLLTNMFEAYEAFLAALAKEETWKEIHRSFLTPSQHAARREFNATAASHPSGLLHGPLLHQLQSRPNDIAVVAGAQRWTYGELDILSVRLAHRLQELGAQPNELVAVVMEKGWQQVVAVLAILRAGAAYQPIEATLPEERRKHLLARGEVNIVLTEAHRVEEAWPSDLAVVSVDPRLLEEGPLESPQHTAKATDLAYVIFTSGSTGEPKGVMTDHRGALNTVIDINERFAVGPGDRVLALSALGFDLSVWDIFGVLGAGGTVVMPEPEARRDPSRWLELVNAHGVTLWNTVPALMEMYVEYVSGREARLGPLRLVMMSGDWIPVTLPDRIRQLSEEGDRRGADLEIISLGGATEASIWSILYPIGKVDPKAASIPYGHPMVNQSFHVLDGALVPRPVWVPGELYIGGVGLAKGYWRDARKTALSFLPRPDAESPGERLYRTGDLGRFAADGEIEFLGREDFQVKVRGHRIELGEIEATLTRHAMVREAAALVLGKATGSQRLAAFVVAHEDAVGESWEEELRHHLGAHLPAYMVPAVFVLLAEMPLTGNGKVDRKALVRHASSDEEPAPRKGRTPPRTPLEEVVAGLWLEVLDVHSSSAGILAIEDDFFELGGDSLRATRLMVLVRQSLGVDLPLRELFEAPTVEGLAAAVAQASGRPPTPSLPLLVPDAAQRFEPFPMTEVQQAYWVGRTGAFDLGNVATHSYVEVEAPGLELDRLERALQRLIERHDMLRAVMLEDGRQQVLEEVPAYEIRTLDLRHHSAEEVTTALEEVRAELSHQVLDPARWPLFDIRATRLPGDSLRLHLSRDALIYDAWSAFILERELTAFYLQPDLEPEPLEATFRDCVLAERALKETEAYAQALRYWRDRIPTLPPAPDLPLAVEPTDLQHPRFERLSAVLQPTVWRAVKELAGGFGLTPSSVLLAVFGEVLAAYARSPHFSLNLTLFNRLPLHPQIHHVVGDFTALALLEIEVEAAQPLRQRARQVQERLWDDLDQRYVGGVRVQRELARARGLRAAAMPVVFTSTLGFPQPEGEGEGGEEREEGGNRLLHSISQTPQVWLDHQVGEMGDELFFNWDYVVDLFPTDFIDTLFEAYRNRLGELVEEEAWERPAVRATAADLERFEGLATVPVESAAAPPSTPAVTGRVQPANELEETLVQIWCEVLERQTVGVEDNFFELGGDSVLGIRIVSAAARKGIEIRPTALFEHQTVAALAHAVTSSQSSSSDLLVELQRGTLPPLFCVHAAGGNVSGYGRLAQALGDEWSVVGLRCRGLLGDEEPRDRVEEMAEDYLEEVRKWQPEGPYRLLGWSSGGHVAFEMAARLEEAGEEVEWLVLLDTAAQMPPGEVDERELLLRLLQANGGHSRAELDKLSFETQLSMIGSLLRDAWGLPAQFDVGEARRLLRVYAANLGASRAFQARPYGGRVVLLRATEEDESLASLGEALGWPQWLQEGLWEEHRVAGRHETLLLPENLPGIVECLRSLGLPKVVGDP